MIKHFTYRVFKYLVPFAVVIKIGSHVTMTFGVSPWFGLAFEMDTVEGWEHGTLHITILWLRVALDIGLHPITTEKGTNETITSKK